MQSIQPTDMRRKTPALELYILNWQGWGTAGAAEKVSLNISVHLFTARQEKLHFLMKTHQLKITFTMQEWFCKGGLLATKEIVKADIEDRSLWHMLLFCLPGKILKSDHFIKCVITLLNKLQVTCSNLNMEFLQYKKWKKSLFCYCQNLGSFFK